ncbi:unnamed protein product [Microthlaspi erraticum]|uniref:Uncharacterized protein n=1 Tax=Microthlaspi erraticum TaxID=1685480 RepID=A0A6D2LIK4_9BRAS|nr:unnamed protein product [Microthlaspi erraticum]
MAKHVMGRIVKTTIPRRIYPTRYTNVPGWRTNGVLGQSRGGTQQLREGANGRSHLIQEDRIKEEMFILNGPITFSYPAAWGMDQWEGAIRPKWMGMGEAAPGVLPCHWLHAEARCRVLKLRRHLELPKTYIKAPLVFTSKPHHKLKTREKLERERERAWRRRGRRRKRRREEDPEADQHRARAGRLGSGSAGSSKIWREVMPSNLLVFECRLCIRGEDLDGYAIRSILWRFWLVIFHAGKALLESNLSRKGELCHRTGGWCTQDIHAQLLSCVIVRRCPSLLQRCGKNSERRDCSLGRVNIIRRYDPTNSEVRSMSEGRSGYWRGASRVRVMSSLGTPVRGFHR